MSYIIELSVYVTESNKMAARIQWSLKLIACNEKITFGGSAL
jgi:hypothetical protein